MSTDLSRDIRVKVCAQTDDDLTGLAKARGVDRQDVLREILDREADRILHECTVVVRFARSEGKSGQGSE